VYSEYEWLPWKFERAPKHMWDEKTAKQFLEWAGKKLGIKELDDWSRVTAKVVTINYQEFISIGFY
jgi:hypothetical protein